MVTIRRVSLAVTGSGLSAALIFGCLATPANAADEHSTAWPSSARSFADTASLRADADRTTGGQIRFDIPTTVEVDPRLEAILTYVSSRDGSAYLDYSAAATVVDPPYLNEFASGFASAGGIVTGNDAFAVDSRAPSRATRNACVGRNRAWSDSWGRHIEMDSCHVDSLANILTGVSERAGGLAAALGKIPGIGQWAQTIATVVGAIIALGAAVLKACGSPRGKPMGATLHVTGVPWCGTQT